MVSIFAGGTIYFTGKINNFLNSFVSSDDIMFKINKSGINLNDSQIVSRIDYKVNYAKQSISKNLAKLNDIIEKRQKIQNSGIKPDEITHESGLCSNITDVIAYGYAIDDIGSIKKALNILHKQFPKCQYSTRQLGGDDELANEVSEYLKKYKLKI
jgi:hypothetical protein